MEIAKQYCKLTSAASLKMSHRLNSSSMKMLLFSYHFYVKNKLLTACLSPFITHFLLYTSTFKLGYWKNKAPVQADTTVNV